MAGKTTPVVKNIEASEFVEPDKVNPYTDAVNDLAKRSEGNENAATVITVDANKSLTEQMKFQKAANLIGKTARVRHVDDSGAEVVGKKDNGKTIYKGDVKITFTLTDQHKQRRGKNSDK